MQFIKIKEINHYKSKSISPFKTPDKIFETYSVPSFDSGHPEYLRGDEIASSKLIVQKDDVLLCKINPRINRVWVVADESDNQNIASSEWIVIRNESYNPRFLAWYFRSLKFQQLMTSEVAGIGGSLTRAQPKRVSEYPAPVLKRDQQDRIVRILDQVSAIQDARQKQLRALDELVKARFIEMFVNKGYPQVLLDKNVEEMFIGPFGSSLKNECFVEKECGYCMVYEQKHAIKKTMDVPTRYVTKDKYLELKRFTILPNDIIVSCRGTIGESFIVPEDAPMGIMHPSVMKIRLKKEKYEPAFFIFLINHYMQMNAEKANGSSVKMAVNAKTLEKESFILPELFVQRKFASFVRQVDQLKSKLRESLTQTETLFNSLMQQYFG